MRAQLFKEVEVFDVVDYPQDYHKVMSGDAYWNDGPIKVLGYYGKFYDMNTYTYFDTEHPRCYHCGKFIKKGNWWRDKYTGPCKDCYERIPRW